MLVYGLLGQNHDLILLQSDRKGANLSLIGCLHLTILQINLPIIERIIEIVP
ncbi:hypothetical protein D1872_297740 [compost metagenome]